MTVKQVEEKSQKNWISVWKRTRRRDSKEIFWHVLWDFSHSRWFLSYWSCSLRPPEVWVPKKFFAPNEQPYRHPRITTHAAFKTACMTYVFYTRRELQLTWRVTTVLIFNRCSLHPHMYNVSSLYHCSQLLPPSIVFITNKLQEESDWDKQRPLFAAWRHHQYSLWRTAFWTAKHQFAQIILHFITFYHSQSRFVGFSQESAAKKNQQKK